MSKKSRGKVGLPPGTLIYTGPSREERVRILVTNYSEKACAEEEVTIERLAPPKHGVSWINVTGIHDVELIRTIGEKFTLHPLLLEDVVHTEQRPKMEEFDQCIFLVLRMLERQQRLTSEQISIVIGKDYVISFQETEGDIFDPIRERLRNTGTRFRRSGADYLGYALIDAITDHYFAILGEIGEEVEELNEELFENPSMSHLHQMQRLRHEVSAMRKSVWPLREAVRSLERSESGLIKKSTLIFLRDVYDHAVQVIENIEMLRDTIAGMLDLYMTSISNRMNEVMKVLTVISTIFIPLTFISGVYGMNFHYMPELTWRYGYFITLGLMLLIVIIMVLYFRRKHWF